MDDINKTTGKDIVYSIVKAGVGSVPLVGSAASELLTLLVASPIENRRAKWMNEVGQKLKELQEAKKLDLNNFPGNEQFVDTVLQATTYALKTSEESKISALKNAIINTALNEAPDKTISQIFLTLIDSFTGLHVKILHLFNDPEEWFNVNNKRLPNYMSAGLINVLTEAYPDLKGQNELLNIIWDDLKRAGLHDSASLNSMMTGSGLLVPRTTKLGKQFLEYVQDHK
jgi:hypothetical protein